MATADLDFSLKISGTPDEIIEMLKVMREYDNGKDGVSFSCTTATINGETIHFSSAGENGEKLFEAVRAGCDCVELCACGPYGRYGMINDVDIFRDMAEVAPNAHFEGSINGNAGYADQQLTACLTDGKLNISTFYLSDDVRGEAESEYMSSLLPYEEFIERFQLDGDEFDTDMYEDFMSEAFFMESPLEFFEETDYEEFLEMIGVDCPLSEEDYKQVVKDLVDLCDDSAVSFDDFMEDYADCEEFVYDPIAKEYVGRTEPVLKSNTAYDATDMIRSYLQENGLPHDDETIAALSVEDVYSIMAGTYGKDTATPEESGTDISEESIEEIAKEFDEEIAAHDPEESDASEEAPSAAEEAVVCEENDADDAEKAAERVNELTDQENVIDAEVAAEEEAAEEAVEEVAVEKVAAEEVTAEEAIAEEAPICKESDAAVSTDAAEAEEVAAESAPQPVEAAEPTVAEPVSNEEACTAAKPKKRSKAWVVWLVIVIVLAALAAVYVFCPSAAEVVNSVIERIAALLE